jgi:hypothetical protein
LILEGVTAQEQLPAEAETEIQEEYEYIVMN